MEAQRWAAPQLTARRKSWKLVFNHALSKSAHLSANPAPGLLKLTFSQGG